MWVCTSRGRCSGSGRRDGFAASSLRDVRCATARSARIVFHLFELQLQLLDLALDPFALRPEHHPAKLGDDQLEMFDLVVVGEQLLVLGNRLTVLGQQQRPQSVGVERAQIGKRGRRNHDFEYAIERVKLHQKMCSLILPPEVPSCAPHAASRCLREASITGRDLEPRCRSWPAAR